MRYSREEVTRALSVLMPEYVKYGFDIEITESLVEETDDEKYYYDVYKYGQNKKIGTFQNPHIRKALQSLITIYGYCRRLEKEKSTARQSHNILSEYPSAVIIKDTRANLSGKYPNWEKLCNKVESGDIVVVNSVSNIGENAEECVSAYIGLFDKGVYLVFLEEPYINAEIYLSENDGEKNYIRGLIGRQIREVVGTKIGFK